jgi:hypothetical protein
MANKTNKATIKIELTLEQREQIRRALGREVAELELTPEALEERIAPGGMSNLCKTGDCTI